MSLTFNLPALLNLGIAAACVWGTLPEVRHRPVMLWKLGVPPLRHDLPLWRTAVLIMIGLGVAFPLVGLSLLAIWALDWAVLSRIGSGKVVAG